MENELEFKQLPYPWSTYEVSKDGSVVKRVEITNKMQKPFLKQQFVPVKGKAWPNGYMYITFYRIDFGADRNNLRYAVHRLVCLAFHGPAPADKPWVNHKNGNKLNNHADNLEWTSISQNIQHAFDTGLRKMPSGEAHWKFGTTTPAAVKKKMSEKKIGELHPKFKGWYVVHGQKYASSFLAAQATGESYRTVIRKCKAGKPGYSFLAIDA